MNKVYDYVTERIIQELEKGKIPWRKTWNGQEAINYISRKPYRGINTLLLPYPGEYLTFKQVQEKKGKIKKGEKANMVVFFKMLEVEGEEGQDGENGKTIPMLRYYNVFHISQTEGIESKCEPFKAENEIDIIEQAQKIIDEYISRSGLKYEVVEGSNRAYYSPIGDKVVMPYIGQFEGSEEYYSTAFHELVHSTGHESRLNRHAEQKTHSFGSKDCSKEELVAEIGATFLCSTAGIEQDDTFKNSTAYIQSWLQRLKDDKTMIVSAAGKAQKAADYILGVTA